MTFKSLASIAILCAILAHHTTAKTTASQWNIVKSDELQWGYLNPLRGDKSPGAANIWGDRTRDSATGMLVRFKPDFSSPPHIHNISYRGVVIEGMIHNDDPKAKKMWMPAGSFWTQPAGESHVTAAKAAKNLIYLEIDSGPYLVKPSADEFNNGEAPINIHKSNIVWQSQNDPVFVNSREPETANLWGSTKRGELGGSLVKLPAGFQGKMLVDAKEFRVVVVKGKILYNNSEIRKPETLLTGSYFDSRGNFSHQITAPEETIFYIRTNGIYRITQG